MHQFLTYRSFAIKLIVALQLIVIIAKEEKDSARYENA